jgi:hypothetical protein
MSNSPAFHLTVATAFVLQTAAEVWEKIQKTAKESPEELTPKMAQLLSKKLYTQEELDMMKVSWAGDTQTSLRRCMGFPIASKAFELLQRQLYAGVHRALWQAEQTNRTKNWDCYIGAAAEIERTGMCFFMNKCGTFAPCADGVLWFPPTPITQPLFQVLTRF